MHPGLYSDSYPGYNKDVYGSSSYRDKLFLAAAWLYRATGVRGECMPPARGAAAERQAHAGAAVLQLSACSS